MSEYSIAYDLAMKAAKEELEREVTPEEALRQLVAAGILDKDGNFTAPYQNLAKVVRDLRK
ncbi:hypothetical protein [Chitinophaga sp. GbtcB8]|uniref:hypothetical protein n=1 Tax=Chitinophaga sp. GbtcB8 TaxID=2824753 RepID=UPI001C307246|nr:hypothetical protein [Chitinophaga sp. GbtcB8]